MIMEHSPVRVNIVDPQESGIRAGLLERGAHGFSLTVLEDRAPRENDFYISPPWIDSHCHVCHGITSFGLRPDSVGWRQGVHLLVDAGSAGEETVPGFRDYVLPCCRTKVLAFLNISSIGLVTMQECFDMRKLDPGKTAACIRAYPGFLLGVKVRSSDVIVEGKGTAPLKRAVAAAEKAECPIMIHMGENPPSNEENLALLRSGDVLSHCFHGKETPLWTSGGEPVPALREALERGVVLDVAHGAASFSQRVAAAAIAKGYRDFIISTDLHGRNICGPVYSLSHTMSKFLALGLELREVIRAVTVKPARTFGLKAWGDCLTENCTLFKLRERRESDPPFMDSTGEPINVSKVIEPAAVIMDGELLEW